MATYRYMDFIDSNTIIPNSSTQKLAGLIKLNKMGIPTPEWLYLDSTEFDYFKENEQLSKQAQEAVKNFVLDVTRKYNLCLFAIRAESKLFPKSAQRPPLSLLNVGIHSIKKNKYLDVRFWNKIEAVYKERWEALSIDFSNLHTRKNTLFGDVEFNIQCFYQSMKIKMQSVVNFDCGIIIQKMVFGHITPCSGSGILCKGENGELNGVFMYGEQGMGVSDGSWGEKEINICEWKEKNETKFNELLLIMQQLEIEYGQNCYLEFTLENNDLYILDYKIRKRNVTASIC